MPKNNFLKLPKLKSILKGGMEQKTQTMVIAFCCCCIVLSLIIFILVLYGANDWSWPEGVSECPEDTGDDAYCVVANQLPVAELPTGVTTACQDAVNPKYGTKPYCHCKPTHTGPKCDTLNLGVCTIKELDPESRELISEVIDDADCPAAGCLKAVCEGVGSARGYKYCETITAAQADTCIPTASAVSAAEEGAVGDAAAAAIAASAAVDLCRASETAGQAACWQTIRPASGVADACQWVEATLATQTSESDCASTDLKTAEWTPNILPDLTVTTPTPS